MALDPRTPVIVGVAQQGHRLADPADAVEPVALMEQMVRAAAADARAPGLLTRLDLVAVVDGAWKYSDPGRLVADAVGARAARTLRSYVGGNTPQSLVNGLAARIQAGHLDVAVITGAETIWSRRRRRAQGLPDNATVQVGSEPDERFQHDVPMSTEFERSRGLEAPIHYYPIFESAIRASRHEDLDAHRQRIAELWADFNAVAVANPHAWSRTPMTADQIRSATDDNRMVGFPYTKVMNSNWDLDQGTALLLCSVGAAESAGVARDRWVFPLAGTDGHDTYAVSERRDLHSSPAIAACGRRLAELVGRPPADADHVDLYSCFPSAVQIGATELGIDQGRRLTVTGGLPFAGGPLNNYVSHSIATMVDVLRRDPGSLGLITANGGYVTKHALGCYSTDPGAGPFAAADVQDDIDRTPTSRVDPDHVGPVTIEGYTVMHDRDGPTTALAALTTPDGARTWGSCPDPDSMAALMHDEGVGLRADLGADGRFALAD